MIHKDLKDCLSCPFLILALSHRRERDMDELRREKLERQQVDFHVGLAKSMVPPKFMLITFEMSYNPVFNLEIIMYYFPLI